MSYYPKSIELTQLVINTENFRFEPVGNQVEAINILINTLADKLLVLAQHIIKHGINPAEKCIVSPDAVDKKAYNVLEGNRRIVALKLLNNPDIAKNFPDFAKKIKKLSEEFSKRPIKRVECVVFDDPENAYEWIRLKHSGQSEGAGTVVWDSQQVARFDEKVEGKSPIALQALNFLKDSTKDGKLKEDLKNVKLSNLGRLLEDPDVRDFVGLGLQKGNLIQILETGEILKGLTQIVKDLLRKDFKVGKIYNKIDRDKYIKDFKKDATPDDSRRLAKPCVLASGTQASKTETAGAPTKKMPLSTERKTVIPKKCGIKISIAKINKVYDELQKLNVNEFENAASVLLRVFVEFSADAFIEKFKIPKINENTTLSKKAEEVANYLERNKLLTAQQLKGIRKAVSTRHDILSFHTFNQYVHNKHFSPAPKDLKISWDNIQEFVVKIWEAIEG